MGVMSWTLTHTPVGPGSPPQTVLADWQTMQLRRGRRTYFDPFLAGTGTITGLNPDSQPAFAIGDSIDIACAAPLGGNPKRFRYYVADYRVDYGFTANEDVWILELEDYFANRARKTRNVSWAAGTTVGNALKTIASLNPYVVGPVNYTGITLSAQSLTNAPLLQVIQTLINTSWNRLTAYGGEGNGFHFRDRIPGWTLQPYAPVTGNAVTFSDVQTPSSTNIVFDRFRFGSLTDDYYDKVIVRPDGLAEQTAGTGDNAYIIDTYNQNTSDAKDLADYLLAIQDVGTNAPVEISALFESQPNATARQRLLADLQVNDLEMFTASVEFRGTVYPVFIVGESWFVSPDQTRVTYNLFSAENYRFLVLNDAVFGKLDENKLGW